MVHPQKTLYAITRDFSLVRALYYRLTFCYYGNLQLQASTASVLYTQPCGGEVNW
jgi:hypothetical protein